jgi:small subunit ribosomal protein S6
MKLFRSYETIFLVQQDAESEVVEKLHKKMLKAIDQEGGIELKLVDWGKRKLAYPIKKQRKANYFYFGYIAAPSCVTEVQRHLRLSSEVLRFQTVCLSKTDVLGNFDLDAERKRVEALTPDRDEGGDDQGRRRTGRREYGSSFDRPRGPRRDGPTTTTEAPVSATSQEETHEA